MFFVWGSRILGFGVYKIKVDGFCLGFWGLGFGILGFRILGCRVKKICGL